MKNTIQKNVLIANFREVPLNSNGTYELPKFGKLKLNGDFKTEFLPKELKYHKSWDWLMPVIDELLNEDLELDNTNLMGDITLALVDIDIKKTFEAVVRLIEYINNQSKDTKKDLVSKLMEIRKDWQIEDFKEAYSDEWDSISSNLKTNFERMEFYIANSYDEDYIKELIEEHFLQDARNKITLEILGSMKHGKEFELNEYYHLYKYIEEDIISVYKTEGDEELIQVMIGEGEILFEQL